LVWEEEALEGACEEEARAEAACEERACGEGSGVDGESLMEAVHDYPAETPRRGSVNGLERISKIQSFGDPNRQTAQTI
jgi:hypothetical protein